MATAAATPATCAMLPPQQGLSLPPTPSPSDPPARPCRRGHGVVQGQASGVWHPRRRSPRAEAAGHSRGAESPLPSALGTGARHRARQPQRRQTEAGGVSRAGGGAVAAGRQSCRAPAGLDSTPREPPSPSPAVLPFRHSQNNILRVCVYAASSCIAGTSP